jgi:signal transduction histidine kinase
MKTPLKVLFVEDTESDAALNLRQLQKSDFSIESKRVDSISGLHAELEASTWDLVLSDFSLPGFNAHEAIRIIRARCPELPIIMVSGTIGEEAAVDVLKAGATDYVLKDRLARLVPAVQRALQDVADRQERLRVEAELHNTERQLHQAQKMEAVGQLVGGVAHDFNNALSVIGLHCDTLADGAIDRGSLTDRVQKIKRAQERAAALTRQLLTFSRKTPYPSQAVNLSAVILETCELMRRLIGTHIQVELDLAPTLKAIWADPTQVEQVLVNLMVNARDAMPTGGILRISAHDPETQEGSDMAAYVGLMVSDTGCGIPEQFLGRIMEPFFSTKEVGKGTGLGLAIVNKILQQNKAKFRIHSEVGRGTEIRILWPRAAESGPSLSAAMPDIEALQGQNQKVLLIEDEGPLRDLLIECLKGNGYTVVAALGGNEALKVFDTASAREVDMILSDSGVLSVNGETFLKELRVKYPNLKVLLMSGSGGHGLEESFGVSTIDKPFSKRNLLSKIGQLLASR